MPTFSWHGQRNPAGTGAGAVHRFARRESGVCKEPRGSCPFPRVTPALFFLSCRHYPKQSFTMVADTPENLRLKQQSELQSQVRGRGWCWGLVGREAVVTTVFGKGSFPLGLLSKAKVLKS